MAAPLPWAIPSAAPAQNSPPPSSANSSAATPATAWSPCASAAASAPGASRCFSFSAPSCLRTFTRPVPRSLFAAVRPRLSGCDFRCKSSSSFWLGGPPGSACLCGTFVQLIYNSVVKRLFLILALFFSASLSAQAPNAVPLSQEPHHHLVLENDYVRVFRVSVPAHAAT